MLQRISLLLVILAIAGSCHATKQPTPRADVKVGYNYHHKFLRGSDGVVEKDVNLLLITNGKQSKFYSPHDNYLDSLESTPSGRALSKQMFNAAALAYSQNKDRSAMDNVVHHFMLYVFKDLEAATVTVFDVAGMLAKGYYTEPSTEIEWAIGDSTRTVLGYECLMAETRYHGRHWTVWFTPEIPIQDGPWKLCGLPGLILEASETTGQHSFTANGIEHCDMEIHPIYNKNEYDRMSRVEMLQSLRKYRDNSNAMIRANIGLDLGTDAPRSEETMQYDFLETDYH